MSQHRSDRLIRVSLGVVGILVLGYGVLRILQDQRHTHPVALGEWLIGALIVHDGIIAPVVIAIGVLLAKVVPPRARVFVQGGLVVGGLISSVGVLLIWRKGKNGSAALTLLQQNYRANLLLILALVTIGTAISYGIAVLRSNRTKCRLPADH
ncbi:MAG TPA: hypothetical protein VGH11_19105 [Jatrophihabitans sp.]|jgi:hypothetical protein